MDILKSPPIVHVQFLLILSVLGLIITYSLLRYSHRVKTDKSILDHIRKAQPILEVFVLILIILWIIARFYGDDPVYSLILNTAFLVILIWSVWFAIRDYVSGIFLRAENIYELNDTVHINQIEGTVRKMGFRSLEIETEDHRKIRIPYSTITRETVERLSESERWKADTFTINMKKTDSATFAIQQLKLTILNCAWSSVGKFPIIELESERDGEFHFEVTVYALERDFFSVIRDHIQNEIPGLVIE